MKKTKLVCILGASLALSGCGNAYANISHGGDVVATVGDVTITADESKQRCRVYADDDPSEDL